MKANTANIANTANTANIAKLLGCAMVGLASTCANATVIVPNTTYRDFDNSSGYINFSVTTHERIADLNVAIEFSKCDNPYIDPKGTACIGKDTPFENEIVIQLIGPDGRTVRLVNENTFDQGSGPGIGRITMSFDDEGKALDRRVQAGGFRPVESLSLFDGMDMFGTWRLFLRDTKASDPFEVFSSRLIFNAPQEPPQAQVPEPGSLAVLGAGLSGMLGLAAWRRRRRSA